MTGSWLETEEQAIESRAALRNELGAVLEDGDLPQERREEVMNALRIGEREVRDEMVPREDVVALSTEVDVDENFRRMAEHPDTRYPLVGEELSAFEGTVYSPVLGWHCDELESGERSLRELAAPPMTLSQDTSVSDAIDQPRRKTRKSRWWFRTARSSGW